jgi:NADH dehydrogenase
MSRTPNGDTAAQHPNTRIVVVGGGFGGAFAVRHLERLFRRRPEVDVILVSRDNFFLMTPLLFEGCSGTLELRHCSVPLRAFPCTAHFVEATVRNVDLERRVVHAIGAEATDYDLAYDQLVLAVGSVTNRKLIPGSDNALTFKTLADAVVLRNHLIEQFERADVETDPARKRKLLTVVLIGAGLVGIELLGELTAFVDEIVRFYPWVRRDDVHFFAFDGGDRILPEIVPDLADYASRVLRRRTGVDIRTGTRVQFIEPERVHLEGETVEAATIVLAAGVLANPLIATLPVEKNRHGQMIVDRTMRCPAHPEVWGVGDCASIPGPDGKPYPTLAQHALREAKTLAHNVHAVCSGRAPEPFVYQMKGMMGSLGHSNGFARVLGFRVRGFLAWWMRRTYYLFQMPGWSRRLRVIIDWTTALLFRPDIVKMDLASEAALLDRGAAAGGASNLRPTAVTSAPPTENAGHRIDGTARVEEHV